MKQIFYLKHWQLFLIFILGFIPVSPLLEICGVISTVMIFLWIYSIVILGQQKLKEENVSSANVNVFRWLFGAIPVFFCATMLSGWYLHTKSELAIFAFVLCDLLTVFSVLYMYYIASKTLTMLDEKRKVNRKEAMRNFYFVALPILGVWFIQPKMKKWTLS